MSKIVFWHHCYLTLRSTLKIGVKVMCQGQRSRSIFWCAAVNIRDSALPSAAKNNKSHYQSKVFGCVSVISWCMWISCGCGHSDFNYPCSNKLHILPNNWWFVEIIDTLIFTIYKRLPHHYTTYSMPWSIPWTVKGTDENLISMEGGWRQCRGSQFHKSSLQICLRTDLTDRLCIAFMFNVGQFPISIFSPICTQIHSNRINHELYSEPSFPAPQLYLLRHTLNKNGGFYHKEPLISDLQ